MGDPAGVGPELCLKVAMAPSVTERCQPILFGDARLLRRVGDRLQRSVPHQVNALAEVSDEFDAAVIDLPSDHEFQPGIVNEATGAASFHYVDAALQATKQHQVDAIVTGPIHKEAWRQAGIPFPGHTELLRERTNAARVCMMLTSDIISCSLVTDHVGFVDVLPNLTIQNVLDAIELSHQAMQRIRDREQIKLSVCGINPHAGEQGLFGNREEEEIIQPAIQLASERGINLVGPISPDTAFTPARRSETDCYVCMYHDQGLIPLKALAFDTAVNVTLGLPIVRTSVDHGTALDIAWQGKASETSFVQAVLLAARLAQR